MRNCEWVVWLEYTAPTNFIAVEYDIFTHFSLFDPFVMYMSHSILAFILLVDNFKLCVTGSKLETRTQVFRISANRFDS